MAEATAATAAARPRPGSSLAPLTSLRFVAAIGVVLFHLSSGFAAEHLGAPLGSAGLPLRGAVGHEVLNAAGTGSLGPNLFFVLSGFVLYWAYEATGRLVRAGRGSFFMARVARLYPVYLVALVVGLVAMQAHVITCQPADLTCTRGRGPGTALAGLVMQQGWLPWNGTANGPAWTLSAEFLFYVSFPVLVPILRRSSVRTTWLWLVAALVATQSWLLVSAFGPARPATYDHSFAAGLWWWVHFAPVFRVPEFVAGLCLGRLYTLGRLPRLRPAAALGIAGAATVAVLYVGRVLTHVPGLDVGMFANLGGFDVLFCTIIAALASAEVPVLSGPRVVLLGEASYALYIIHWPVWYVMAWASPLDLARSGGFLVWSALYLVVLVALSVASFRFLETPARNAITSWWRGRSPVVVAAR